MLTARQLEFFQKNGFLILENFGDPQPIIKAADELVKKAEPPQSIFKTGDDDHVGDEYFLASVILNFYI